MTAHACPCGQTYGTCKKHKGAAPPLASFLFVRTDGLEWYTHIVRPKRFTDEQWQEAISFAAENIAKNLVDAAERNPVA